MMENQVDDDIDEKDKVTATDTTTTITTSNPTTTTTTTTFPSTITKKKRTKIFVIGDSISIQYGPYLEEYLKGFDIDYYRKEDGDDNDGMTTTTTTALSSNNLDQPMGANGGDSSMVLRYLQSLLLPHNNNNNNDNNNKLLQDVDYLLINCGLHDIKTNIQSKQIQIPLNQYKQNLIDIIKLVQSSLPHHQTTKLIWIRTTPLDEENHNNTIKYQKKFHRYEYDLMKYNDAADDIMIQYNIPTIDLYQFTNNLKKHVGGKIYCDHIHFHAHVREKQGSFLAGWIISTISSSQHHQHHQSPYLQK